MPTTVMCLRWTDVDPAAHSFDASRVAAIVDGALPEQLPTSPRLDEKRWQLERRIDRALLAELGPWIAGPYAFQHIVDYLAGPIAWSD